MLVDWYGRVIDGFQQFSGYLNTVVIALVILLGGFIFGRLVDRALHKLLLRIQLDTRVSRIVGARRNYARASRTTLVYVIYVMTIFLALEKLKLDVIATTFVLIMFVFIILVSFVLAGVEFLPHVIGRWQLRSRSLEKGMRVEITDSSGTVKGTIVGVTLFDLRVKRPNGDILFYPTAMLPRVKLKKYRR